MMTVSSNSICTSHCNIVLYKITLHPISSHHIWPHCVVSHHTTSLHVRSYIISYYVIHYYFICYLMPYSITLYTVMTHYFYHYTASGLELLVQNLSRLDESSDEDAQGVNYTMGCIENLVEIRPSIAISLCERTHILKFLLLRLKVRTHGCTQIMLFFCFFQFIVLLLICNW